MASLLPEGKQSFTGSDGLPLVGGKLYTYDAGTTTPRPTYSDAAGTVPNTNPVVLDARGEATIFWSGSYKVVLKDSADNTIWSQDNVTDQIGLLSSSSGSSLVGFLQAGVGATPRTMQDKAREVFSSTDFTSMQVAINAAAGVSGAVFVPPGSYTVGQLTFPAGLKGFFCIPGTVTLNISGTFTAYSPILFFNGMSDFYVGGFKINADTTTYATNHAMQFGACSKGVVEKLRFTAGGYIALYAPGCSDVTFRDIIADTYAVSLFLADSSPSRLTLDNVKGLAYGTGVGIGITGGQYHKIMGCYSPGAGASFFSIGLYQASDSTIEECTAIGINREAIQITDGSRNQILDNRVYCNPGHTDFGISIFSNGADIKQNKVSGNIVIGSGGPGIGVSAAYTPAYRVCQLNDISDNLIVNPCQNSPAGNGGILLLGGAGCTGNVIANNTCVDESNKMQYGVNEWNSGGGGEGNPDNNRIIHNACFGGAGFLSEAKTIGASTEAFDLEWQSYATTITAQSGSITTVNTGASYLKYKRRGRSADVSARASITTNGTGAGSVQMTTPFTIQNGGPVGRENGVSGKLCYGYSGGAGSMRIAFYDGTYPGANGAQINLSGTVEI